MQHFRLHHVAAPLFSRVLMSIRYFLISISSSVTIVVSLLSGLEQIEWPSVVGRGRMIHNGWNHRTQNARRNFVLLRLASSSPFRWIRRECIHSVLLGGESSVKGCRDGTSSTNAKCAERLRREWKSSGWMDDHTLTPALMYSHQYRRFRRYTRSL